MVVHPGAPATLWRRITVRAHHPTAAALGHQRRALPRQEVPVVKEIWIKTPSGGEFRAKDVQPLIAVVAIIAVVVLAVLDVSLST